MTGAQLKKLRQDNGLSERQFAKMLGFSESARKRDNDMPKWKVFSNVNPAKRVRKLENNPFVPEPLVHLINAMVAEGKLVAR